MTAHKPGDPTTLNRLYGRSSGHKLRKGQADLVETLLPQISVPTEGELTAARLFGEDRPLHLEIGFGSGEHLAYRADLLPDHARVKQPVAIELPSRFRNAGSVECRFANERSACVGNGVG